MRAAAHCLDPCVLPAAADFVRASGRNTLLRRSEVSEHGLRGLTAFLRREAVGIYNSIDLAAKARVWLIDHGYLLPTEREIRRQTDPGLAPSGTGRVGGGPRRDGRSVARGLAEAAPGTDPG